MTVGKTVVRERRDAANYARKLWRPVIRCVIFHLIFGDQHFESIDTLSRIYYNKERLRKIV